MQDPDSVQPSLMACCMDNSQRTGETICSANIFTMSCASRCCNTLVSELSKSERYLLAKKQKESCETKSMKTSLQTISGINTCNKSNPLFSMTSYMKKTLPKNAFHKFDGGLHRALGAYGFGTRIAIDLSERPSRSWGNHPCRSPQKKRTLGMLGDLKQENVWRPILWLVSFLTRVQKHPKNSKIERCMMVHVCSQPSWFHHARTSAKQQCILEASSSPWWPGIIATIKSQVWSDCLFHLLPICWRV